MRDLVRHIIRRDLQAARRELEHYEDERDIWRTPPGITNSAGTLALHLAGNLRFLIGAQLGDSGYVRDRNAEFARRDVPRAELIAGLEQAEADVDAALESVEDARLDGDYPLAIGGSRLAAAEFLVHLVDHLGYHVGQIDYHRRLVTGDGRGVSALSIAALGSARPDSDPS